MGKSRVQKLTRRAQAAEITEYEVYRRLAHLIEKEADRKRLKKLARDELEHYEIWREVTHRVMRPSRIKVFLYMCAGRLLGLTFALRLMEKREDLSQRRYRRLFEEFPKARSIEQDELRHEDELVAMIDEESLTFAGSIVLGLNDALVEITGAIAGLTLALQDSRLVAAAAFITGISAALSMAASEYLSKKAEENTARHARRASVYTGIAYLIAVILLIYPYLFMTNPLLALLWAVGNAIAIIAAFNFYIAVTKNMRFVKRFAEMIVISLSVAFVSFLIGLVIRRFLGVSA
jgi:VIT1/CCC1 family predicted Fe2+/Mn2+ transporter